MAMEIIPVAGQVLPFILMPVFSFAFMQACAQIEQGTRVFPNVLLAGFRSPSFRELLKLGALYLLAGIVATSVTSLFDGGLFWNLTTGEIKLSDDLINDVTLSFSVMIWMLSFIIVKLPLWYAAPLIVWQNMGVAKAVFYSTLSVYRNARVFLTYGLSLAAVYIALTTVVSLIAALLLGKSSISYFILVALFIVYIVIMYCSFYPTYTSIFGKPYETPAATTE